MNNILNKIVSSCCFVYYVICPYTANSLWSKIIRKLYTLWICNAFKSYGKNIFIGQKIYLIGGQYITIGEKTTINKHCVLTAWDKYGDKSYTPEIIIGDSVIIGEYSHISAINKIVIGNNVLTGRRVTIVDNAHGGTELNELEIAPIKRELISKGVVIIEDNVWIGDKVSIMPGVHIGKGAVVGANAVVTKDVPANSVVGGIPAKVIKQIK